MLLSIRPVRPFRRPLLRAALVLPFVLALAKPGFAEIESRGQFTAAFSSYLGTPSLEGEFQIVTEGGQSFLEFGTGFRSKSGPDLKIFLTQRAPEKVTGKNAVSGSVRLGLLMEFEGSQRYLIPEGTDLSRFTTVIIHCEAYSKLWGTGVLR